MAEKDIRAEDFFNFAENKNKSLCRVKHCRNDRMPDRRICHKCHMRLWRARNPTRSAYHALNSSAASKKISFTLTFEEFSELCSTTTYIENKGHHRDALHIDREDPNKGYDISNIRVLTCSENSRKGSYERWITLKSGKRVRMCDIGIGVPSPEPEPQYASSGPDEDDMPAWLKVGFNDSDNEPF